MRIRSTNGLRVIVSLVIALALGVSATPAQADCSGCICPGDPCRLCAIPPMKNIPLTADEPDTCRRIREKVPPISASPGSNEHFASQDKATMECIKSGGDIIKNHHRTKDFPSKLYCKPYAESGKVNAKIRSGSK